MNAWVGPLNSYRYGVYVTRGYGCIVLTPTDNGIAATNQIVLTTEVLEALNQWIARQRAQPPKAAPTLEVKG